MNDTYFTLFPNKQRTNSSSYKTISEVQINPTIKRERFHFQAESEINPCSEYNNDSIGVSAQCIQQLWKESGCPNSSFIKPDYEGVWTRRTLQTIKNDMKGYTDPATTPLDKLRSCYGDLAMPNTEQIPAQSPDQLYKMGIRKNGDYWYLAGTMTSPLKLYTIFNGPDQKPWVKVFSSITGQLPGINHVGKGIPFKGFRITANETFQTDSSKEAYSYFPSRQFFNERTNTTMVTEGGNRPGFRVFIGKAGGMGLYTQDQRVCDWPRGIKDGKASIGAGFNGSNCGTYPNNLLWGTGRESNATYDLDPNSEWSVWIWWDNLSSDEEWMNWTSHSSMNLKKLDLGRPVNGKFPQESSSKYLDALDLFPFKVVSMQYLVDMGKMQMSPKGWGNDKTQFFAGGGWYNWGRVNFNPTDLWLPVGDICYQFDMDWNKVPVLLVKNDPLYSMLIFSSNWVWSGDKYDCDDQEWNQSYYHVTNSDNFQTDYAVLGSAMNFGEPRREQSSRAYWNRTECIAAVNKKYLTNLGSAFQSSNYLGEWDRSCYHGLSCSYSTPFFNFRMKTLGGTSFYDIVPRSMFAKCCAGSLPIQIDKTKYCGQWNNPSSPQCGQAMLNYCTGANLLTDDCLNYIKTQNQNFNSPLQSYCSSTGADRSHPNFLDVCSCFFPQSFYDEWRTKSLSSSGDERLTKLLLSQYRSPVIPKCEYPFCSNTTSIQPYQNPPVSCPNIQIQQCINQSYTSSDGATFSESPIDQSQAINCLQSSETKYVTGEPPQTTESQSKDTPPPTTTTPTSPPPTSPPPTPSPTIQEKVVTETKETSETNKTSSFLDRFQPLADIIGTSPGVVLGGLVVIILLIIAILYYFINKRNQPQISVIPVIQQLQ